MIQQLFNDAAQCKRLGEQAAETARKFTWERNGRELTAIFQEILLRKESSAAPALAHDPTPAELSVENDFSSAFKVRANSDHLRQPSAKVGARRGKKISRGAPDSFDIYYRRTGSF
jgi:hypothetical protein